VDIVTNSKGITPIKTCWIQVQPCARSSTAWSGL